MGVLTSRNTIGTLGVAVNRTISHHLDNVVFFTGTRNRKVPHGMLVVSHGDERPIWNMFQNLKYVFEHYINEYDWFYFVQDDAYTEAERLKLLVEHLSVERELYLGRPEEFIGGATEGRYCYGGFGYILSRALLLRLRPFLENCRNDILSARPDEWLGRCIIDYTSTNCVGQFEVSWAGPGRARRLPAEVLASGLIMHANERVSRMKEGLNYRAGRRTFLLQRRRPPHRDRI